MTWGFFCLFLSFLQIGSKKFLFSYIGVYNGSAKVIFAVAGISAGSSQVVPRTGALGCTRE